MIGRKVRLTERMAKWYLENPDIFFFGSNASTLSEGYDEVMQHSLLVLMGEDVIGEIISRGADSNVFGVEFKTKLGNDFSYYELNRDIELV